MIVFFIWGYISIINMSIIDNILVKETTLTQIFCDQARDFRFQALVVGMTTFLAKPAVCKSLIAHQVISISHQRCPAFATLG